MTNEQVDEVVRDIEGWMNEAQRGALMASEVRRLMQQVRRLAKAAKARET